MDDPLSRPSASPPLLDASVLTPEKVDDISSLVNLTPGLKKLSVNDPPPFSSSPAPRVHPVNPLSIHPTPKSPPPALSPSSSTSSSSPRTASSPTSSSPPPALAADASFSQRLLHFHHCMNMERIPRRVVQSFVFDHGSPDQKGMRSLLWKLLLGYLPWVHSEWEASLRKSRASYDVLVKELCTNPYSKMGGAGGGGGGQQKVSLGDDPLASQSNEWSEYYKDEAIRAEIDKDVKRTYSSFHFFQERVRPIVITLEEARKAAKAEAAHVPSLFDQPLPPSASSFTPPSAAADVTRAPPAKDDETHQDVIRRILFIYAKLNPGVRYVQGMNEILAPMYYVFAHDANPLFAQHAEADAFFCFTAVMSDIRDRFIKSLDSSPSGVLAVVKLINTYLHDLDPELWAHLEAEKVDPRFYSFRWITLLLSQEFELPEVMRLWDSLFADENRFEFLLYCCCSMLVCIRDRLLAGDFADALRMLQHYQDQNIQFLTILSTASRLKKDLEATRRGEIPSNPVVKQTAHHTQAHAATREAASVAQGGGGARAASPPLANAGQQLSAAAEAAQATAGQLFKSVSNFFGKK